MAYGKYNEQLKRDLPKVLKLTGRIVQPCYEAVVQFQKVFFVWLRESAQRITSDIDSETDVAVILSTHQRQLEEARAILSNIPLLNPNRRKTPQKIDALVCRYKQICLWSHKPPISNRYT